MFLKRIVYNLMIDQNVARLDSLQRRWRRRARRWGFARPMGEAAMIASEACWEARNALLGWPGAYEKLAFALRQAAHGNEPTPEYPSLTRDAESASTRNQ